MNTNKHKLFPLLALLLATSLNSAAATAPVPAATTATATAAAPKDGVNQIKAYLVVGDVRIRDAKGVVSPLARNAMVPPGSSILTGTNGNTLLMFSNGAAMQVKPKSEVGITKFEQADYDTVNGQKTFLRLEADPSKSTTVLDLKDGTLTGDVKKLNQAAGSTFTVNTPAGAATIHGTIPTFTVIRNANGQITGVTVQCSQGTVSFLPSTIVRLGNVVSGGQSVDVQQGGQLKISITTNTNGQLTGISVTGESYTGVEAQSAIESLYSAINEVRADQGLPPIPPPPAAPPSPPNPSGNNGAPPNNAPNTNPSTISE